MITQHINQRATQIFFTFNFSRMFFLVFSLTESEKNFMTKNSFVGISRESKKCKSNFSLKILYMLFLRIVTVKYNRD